MFNLPTLVKAFDHVILSIVEKLPLEFYNCLTAQRLNSAFIALADIHFAMVITQVTDEAAELKLCRSQPNRGT